MSLPEIAIVAIVTIVAFLWQLIRRPRGSYWAIDFLSVGVMIGFVAVGVLHYLVQPNLDDTVNLLWYYAPHAYNLVIWPLFALTVLRPRFGSKYFLLTFVFVYGFDEILWNSIAYVRFGGNLNVLSFILTAYWQTFFAIVVIATVASYIVVRPRIVPNWTWGFFPVYVFVYSALAGLPTFVNPGTSPSWYIYTWEVAWQAAFLLFVFGTFQGKKDISYRSASSPSKDNGFNPLRNRRLYEVQRRLHTFNLDIGAGSHPITETSITLDTQRAKSPTVVVDASAGLPFRDGSFDSVTALEVLEHMSESERLETLIEVNRVLTKHGQLVVTVPYISSFMSIPQAIVWYVREHTTQREYHHNSYTKAHIGVCSKDTLEASLQRCGFEVKESSRLMIYDLLVLSEKTTNFSSSN